MAVIKCKMCGGDLALTPDSTVAECEYCGTRQTVPTADSEKKLTLFARANRLRLACEFDKAAGVYENIVSEFPTEAEAYWGLVLCRYGIEYVDDPATGKKVPTCHRSSFDSVLEDSDFEQACENADAVARRVYRDEAKAIEDIRRGILEVSGKEPPYDIFICYKETDENGARTVDSVLAQDVYDALTEKGYRVFFSRITLEDKLGTEYEPYIFAALNSAKLMLVFGTDYEYFNAVWVKNEWSRFLKLMAQDKNKHLIPCYKNVDAYDMPKEFQKLQGQDMGKVGAVQDLLRGIDKLLGKGAVAQAAVSASTPGGPTVESLLRRAQLFLEDGNWKSANEYFDKVLDINPECAEAYVGKFCAENHYRIAAEMAERLPQGVGDELVRTVLELCAKGKTIEAVKYVREQRGISLPEAKQTVEQLTASGRLAAGNQLAASSATWEKALRFAAPALRAQLEAYQAAAEQLAQQAWQQAEADSRRYQQTAAEHRDFLAARRAQVGRAAACLAVKMSRVVGLKAGGTVLTAGCGNDRRASMAKWSDIKAVATSDVHSVGLRWDGTVVAAASKENCDRYHLCDVEHWRDITAIAVGALHTVGLKSNGTVVAVGENGKGQCLVKEWKNIVAIVAGAQHTVGLRADGTVVAVGGDREKGPDDVKSWTNITAIAAGRQHTVGLRSDGTVTDTSRDHDVSSWADVVAVVAGDIHGHTVGLRSDGTVVSSKGRWSSAYQEVDDWSDIVAIAMGGSHVVGLRSDGTVVCTDREQDVSGWTDVVAVAAGDNYTLGVRSNGTVLSVASTRREIGGIRVNYQVPEEKNIASWRLFRSLNTLDQEREGAHRRDEQRRLEAKRRSEEVEQRRLEEKQRRQEERAKRRAALEAEKSNLQTELSNLRGLFTGKRRREIEARLAEVEEELKRL